MEMKSLALIYLSRDHSIQPNSHFTASTAEDTEMKKPVPTALRLKELEDRVRELERLVLELRILLNAGSTEGLGLP